jgi:transcriptional regulator with XRE-family HTH domain
MPKEKQTLRSLGARIKVARKSHSMTQEELASRVNVTNITVSRWETGKQSPDYPTLCKLSETFDMPISLLTDNPNSDDSATGDFLYIISGGLKKQSNVATKFEKIIRDVGKLNPDLLVTIHELEQKWDDIGATEKQIISDGFAFVLGHFAAYLMSRKPQE